VSINDIQKQLAFSQKETLENENRRNTEIK
jgi:hypothetical protein